tara:strand:- start:472 stop:1083 length:612 start_codon:yes stop_codon:yes gene_type:complete
MKYSFDESELTSEKSLWDVYKLSRRILPSRFNSIAVLLVTGLLAVNSFVLEADTGRILSATRKWAEVGFSFSIATLGFLIAGFTIFATLSKPKMMLAMMEHTNKGTGLPTLKYNYFAFMQVFIAYILFSSIFILIHLFGMESGLLSNLLRLIPDGVCIKLAIIKSAYCFVGGSIFYLLLLLKSFVFNIYAIVMNFLRWEYHQD